MTYRHTALWKRILFFLIYLFIFFNFFVLIFFMKRHLVYLNQYLFLTSPFYWLLIPVLSLFTRRWFQNWVRSRYRHWLVQWIWTTTFLVKYICQSWDCIWDSVTERTISCIQILEVRVHWVVVDMHVNQPLQKKQKWYRKHNVSNQRVSVSLTTLLFQSLFLIGTLISSMPFFVYPVHSDLSKE